MCDSKLRGVCPVVTVSEMIFSCCNRIGTPVVLLKAQVKLFGGESFSFTIIGICLGVGEFGIVGDSLPSEVSNNTPRSISIGLDLSPISTGLVG